LRGPYYLPKHRARFLKWGFSSMSFCGIGSRMRFGESETLVGNALGGVRREIVLATKVRLPMSDNLNRRGATRVNILRELEEPRAASDRLHRSGIRCMDGTLTRRSMRRYRGESAGLPSGPLCALRLIGAYHRHAVRRQQPRLLRSHRSRGRPGPHRSTPICRADHMHGGGHKCLLAAIEADSEGPPSNSTDAPDSNQVNVRNAQSGDGTTFSVTHNGGTSSTTVRLGAFSVALNSVPLSASQTRNAKASLTRPAEERLRCRLQAR
jgi:hypothetical protein